MYVGALEIDVLFDDVRSLKQKRSHIKPILAELKKYGVAVSEVGEPDRLRRALIGISAVSRDVGHVHEVLNTCERHVAGRPELELLSVRRRILGPED
ncbi:DUF503 domain-containing protein [Hoyosella rhizosphaerae]|uniref:DUF503 domain-containing protein n=1 Tax=Hoyosella rhizosphaerae TaxID=1755582 RepID=A0A916XB58_9ACTN|nr:DUF503 domain-containing protein [Hoyosella rhizosphaerae]MBN4926294.1 DUF503 domain-containing protein [Hoyosella rhizosphaerae]GGC60482.1 hypothetical protein GCM10011410_11220 [Hoyosella rhizosphaerae]